MGRARQLPFFAPAFVPGVKLNLFAPDIFSHDVLQVLAEVMQPPNLLIHDAQYTNEHYWGLLPGLPSTQGFGHSTSQMACQVAQAAKIGMLALFHYAPNYDDERLDALQTEGQRGFAKTIAPHEGLQISLGVESARSPRVIPVEMPATFG